MFLGKHFYVQIIGRNAANHMPPADHKCILEVLHGKSLLIFVPVRTLQNIRDLKPYFIGCLLSCKHVLRNVARTGRRVA